MIDSLLAILAPHSCCGCGYHGSLLCDNCKYDIISEPLDCCIACLKPTVRDNLCSACRTKQPFAAAWLVGVRRGALKTLLDRYKFSSARRAGYEAADLLDARLPVLLDSMVIVPVPTSPLHRRVRGFDHTAMIAKRLAKLRGLRYAQALARDNADTQHFLGRSERLAAASKGLRLAGSVPENVLLLDDIYTTGATLHASAQLLRDNGAKTVSVAVIARQVLDEDADLW